MIFDRASYHSTWPDYPNELPPECGGIYGAIFLTWVITRGHLRPESATSLSTQLTDLEAGRLSPLELYTLVGGLDSTMLNEEAGLFAFYCFETDEFSIYQWFEEKYCRGLRSSYHFELTPESLKSLHSDLDDLFQALMTSQLAEELRAEIALRAELSKQEHLRLERLRTSDWEKFLSILPF